MASAKTKNNSKKKAVRILSSRVVFRGPLFQITSDQVKEPSGVTARRDILRHPGSVVIIAVQVGPSSKKRGAKSAKAEPHVLLEWQYRYAANQFLWEVPAGRIDEGEENCPPRNVSCWKKPVTRQKNGNECCSTIPVQGSWMKRWLFTWPRV